MFLHKLNKSGKDILSYILVISAHWFPLLITEKNWKQASTSCLNSLSIKIELIVFEASMMFPLYNHKINEHSDVWRTGSYFVVTLDLSIAIQLLR